jgi:uncharacterized protein YndB with AHSA1/START domain
MPENDDRSGGAAERGLSIARVFDAPRSVVYEVWTDVDHLRQWWGPKDFTTEDMEVDFRVGGRYRARIRDKQGKAYTMHGSYREITPPERLVFTHRWEEDDGTLSPDTSVTVTFEQVGAQTRLTFAQTGFESDKERDSHRGGWEELLDGLAGFLAHRRARVMGSKAS